MGDKPQTPRPISIGGPHEHRHRCLRCDKEFDCPQQPGDCAAGYDVMPDIIIRSGNTWDTYVHCPHLEPRL